METKEIKDIIKEADPEIKSGITEDDLKGFVNPNPSSSCDYFWPIFFVLMLPLLMSNGEQKPAKKKKKKKHGKKIKKVINCNF